MKTNIAKKNSAKKNTRSEQTTDLELAVLRHIKLYGFSTHNIIGRLFFPNKKNPGDSARHLVAALNNRLERRANGFIKTRRLPFHDGERFIHLTKAGSDKTGGTVGKTRPSQFRYSRLLMMYGQLLFCTEHIVLDGNGKGRETRPKISWPEFQKMFGEYDLDDESYSHDHHAVETIDPEKHAGNTGRINQLLVVGNAHEPKLLLRVFRKDFIDRWEHPGYQHLMQADAFCFRFIVATPTKRDALFRSAEAARNTLTRSPDPVDDPELFDEFLRRVRFSVQTPLEKLL